MRKLLKITGEIALGAVSVVGVGVLVCGTAGLPLILSPVMGVVAAIGLVMLGEMMG